MKATPHNPAMSVVLATPTDFRTIATTVHHLRRQTIADRLELVVVAQAPDALASSAGAFHGFWGHQVIGVGPFDSVGRANAAGVRAARGPVVVFAEDHCFPDQEWAEALLERHSRGDVAVVGPVFRNANPGTLVSWCDFVIGYGPWIDPSPTGDRPFLAGHNSSYQKAVLLDLGASLDRLLASETVLHLELGKRGHRLALEPRARTAHTNFGKLTSWLPVQYHSGRLFAAERASRWHWSRRAFYAVASPLIPWVRWARALGHLRGRPDPCPSRARLGPLLWIGLAADGVGQLVGYLAGAGSSPQKLTRYEYRRIDHVPASDRHLWANVGRPELTPPQA
jgi:hypothetical protein